MSSKDKIRAFILSHIPEDELLDDRDIFAEGLVSSMFVMQLVLFVEQEFGISIQGEDLDFVYFRSVDAVDELVNRKLAA